MYIGINRYPMVYDPGRGHIRSLYNIFYKHSMPPAYINLRLFAVINLVIFAPVSTQKVDIFIETTRTKNLLTPAGVTPNSLQHFL